MSVIIKRTRRKRWRIVTSAILLIIAVPVMYYAFYTGPEQVNSGIYKLVKIFTAHTAPVWTVQFSPDGNLLASGSVDSSVKVWKKNGELVHNFRNPCGVTFLEFSPDGNYIATSGYDSKVRLWRLRGDTIVREFKGHTGTVWAVTFSPDGKTIASSGEDSAIKIWDVENGDLIRTLHGHHLNVWTIKYSPDGSKIASGSFDNKIKIWDAKDGKLLRTIKGHTEAVLTVTFSSDGQILASGSDDETIRLWNMADGKLIKTFKGRFKHVYGIQISPDNKKLMSGCKDRDAIGEFFQNIFGTSKTNKWVTGWLWDVTSGKVLQTFSEHSNDINDVAYSPDGKWIATASEDHTVDLWHLDK